MSKKLYLDNVSKNFIDNLKIETPLYEMEPECAREFIINLQKQNYIDIPATVENIEIFDVNYGNINVKLVKPQSNNEILPIVIYCHGGGWVLGDFNVYEMTVKTIANWINVAVAFVEYPRSPEFIYPNALNQICGAVEFLHENADKYNLNREKMAIVGDSAGGNLATACAMKLKDKNFFCFEALIYPVCDADMKTDSYSEFKNGPWLSKKAMEWFFDCYVPEKETRKDIFVSPLKAELEDLKGLPSTLIITAENDVLRDEGEQYARKLIEAGVDSACVRINNTFHDFMLLNSLKESMSVKAGYKLLCKFLQHKFKE